MLVNELKINETKYDKYIKKHKIRAEKEEIDKEEMRRLTKLKREDLSHYKEMNL